MQERRSANTAYIGAIYRALMRNLSCCTHSLQGSEDLKAREEARAIAAAAIAAARAAQAGTDLEGRPQVTEVRDFAGEKIE